MSIDFLTCVCGLICLNLVRMWFIFSTRTFVLNAVKEPGLFGGGCALIKAFGTGSQIAFNIIISPTRTPSSDAK